MEYVSERASLYELNKKVKAWERKVEIAEVSIPVPEHSRNSMHQIQSTRIIPPYMYMARMLRAFDFLQLVISVYMYSPPFSKLWVRYGDPLGICCGCVPFPRPTSCVHVLSVLPRWRCGLTDKRGLEYVSRVGDPLNTHREQWILFSCISQ